MSFADVAIVLAGFGELLMQLSGSAARLGFLFKMMMMMGLSRFFDHCKSCVFVSQMVWRSSFMFLPLLRAIPWIAFVIGLESGITYRAQRLFQGRAWVGIGLGCGFGRLLQVFHR